MQIKSPVFVDNKFIPKKYAYKSENISPPLDLVAVPLAAKSWALTVIDPDSPNGNFTHWVVWNIPISRVFISEGALPQEARQGLNDFGNIKWDGPAPPSGVHRYIFKAYAVDAFIHLPAGANRSDLELNIIGHELEHAILTGLYSSSY